MFYPPKGLCKADTEGGPIVFTYRAYHSYSPPLWKFFLVKKGGVNICVTGKLKKNRRKKGGGGNKGVTGSLKKIQADKKGGVN